ncbi:heavy metal-binding domain-containing protein [Chitinophaga japonensis]|uniref:Cu+-exporting ATPase n=1 Tax=Chitinophaga japonensis TaxID=104662 RepID=A0A562SP18_CHIJA|nr:heavy metal-binding domain-containing protein [Chitinophaga japonensis]TWI82634.1 Cu+-exporting ATPase [Chitinophaga japonensis]
MKKLIILLIAVVTSFVTFAQEKAGRKDTTKHVALYTCSMHPDVMSDKPGKCRKCNMDLTLSKKEQMKREITKTYTCPVHADVISDKPGKCPKCGKDLFLSPKEKMKMEVVGLYTCPMHPDIKSKKPGTCPKCGMKLAQQKEKNDRQDSLQ